MACKRFLFSYTIYRVRVKIFQHCGSFKIPSRPNAWIPTILPNLKTVSSSSQHSATKVHHSQKISAYQPGISQFQNLGLPTFAYAHLSPQPTCLVPQYIISKHNNLFLLLMIMTSDCFNRLYMSKLIDNLCKTYVIDL